jgi:hypothetical protein
VLPRECLEVLGLARSNSSSISAIATNTQPENANEAPQTEPVADTTMEVPHIDENSIVGDASEGPDAPHPAEQLTNGEVKPAKSSPPSPQVTRAATSPLLHHEEISVHLPGGSAESQSGGGQKQRRDSRASIDDSTGSVESYGSESTVASAGGVTTYRKSRFHRPAFLKRFIRKAKDGMLPPIPSTGGSNVSEA